MAIPSGIKSGDVVDFTLNGKDYGMVYEDVTKLLDAQNVIYHTMYEFLD